LSKTIEELRNIVADENRTTEERKHAAELILAMQGKKDESAGIADDDPRLKAYLTDPNSETAKLFPSLCSTTVEQAKEAMARDLSQKQLLATAVDEALPLPQRVEAAVAWRSLRPAGNRWAHLSDTDLVEALSEHPQLTRLQELSALVCSPSVPKGDWKAYVQDQWSAIAEFHELRQKFPLRDAPVIISLEAVAGRVIKNNPAVLSDFVARQEIYGYAKGLQGKAGA
jgi:hypothetical protein